jgi:hypothetical protein
MHLHADSRTISCMPRKKVMEGPIGTGWIDEVQTGDGKKFVAKWNKFVADPEADEGS